MLDKFLKRRKSSWFYPFNITILFYFVTVVFTEIIFLAHILKKQIVNLKVNSFCPCFKRHKLWPFPVVFCCPGPRHILSLLNWELWGLGRDSNLHTTRMGARANPLRPDSQWTAFPTASVESRWMRFSGTCSSRKRTSFTHNSSWLPVAF